MTFKYQDDIGGISSCPPRSCKQLQITAYRVVFSNPPAEDSFIPVGKLQPDRANRCEAWALSLFKSEAGLMSRVATLKKNHKNILKKLGDKIAEGIIDHGDGICSEANSFGHFDLHEFAGAQIWTKFKVIGNLQ